ncbi:MAG: tRNA N6-adenosine(37)-N6-threonylcarbamoyltransferase complex dimerization subunit TsaB [Bacteriovoracaceae bacterium]|nr:tRNA N6-adenosine(37)-N6-threonylcarbamoyltransferase complex dimerization subunit TsaB [Bacteriovoracaceae bacterium]
MRLVFDTSTAAVSLGILTEEGWMETVDRADIPKQQSKVLLVMIQDLFRPFGIEMKEVKEIAVGEGPGSFTGLRMGMTVAKIWAYTHKADLFTFSSSKLLEKTKLKEPDALYPKIKYLEDADFRKLPNLNDLIPIYENDHFA